MQNYLFFKHLYFKTFRQLKMKYLNGSAMVIYGIPMSLTRTMTDWYIINLSKSQFLLFSFLKLLLFYEKYD